MPVVLFALASFRTEAAELWEFVQVGKSNQVKPTWVVHAGKAQIEEDGRHLEIFAYYDGDDANGRSNPRDIARMVISGTIGSDRTIEATATLLNTDRSPWKVSGRYVVRTEHEIWGGIRKVVTYKEIIFGHPPNAESLGFLGRDVRDE
jgi:hypothetical protein